VLYRVREDKDPRKLQFGNHYTVAEETFFNIINFIDLSDLYDISFQHKMYFQRARPKEYDQMTKHINLMKRAGLSRILYKNQTIVDLGCGQGQDVNKYATAGVATAIMVDRDLDAL